MCKRRFLKDTSHCLKVGLELRYFHCRNQKGLIQNLPLKRNLGKRATRQRQEGKIRSLIKLQTVLQKKT